MKSIVNFLNDLYLDAYLVDIWDDNKHLVSFIMNPISEINIEENVARLYDDDENMIVIYFDNGTLSQEDDRVLIKVGTKEYSFIKI